ncbi:MAG: hypothetical protein KatS3mg060_2001 [Dehalococcoidia bacterium]|nr:MAG: hypothetical protein KatS3mg060_2001 [Dehalococcoidia bacterium]
MRENFGSESPWEPRIGFSRAVRVGNQVFVAGTTGLGDRDQFVGNAGAQTAEALRRIEAALVQAGATLEDVVRTRLWLRRIADLDAVASVHRAVFGAIRPASTVVEVTALADPRMLIEIEADAVIGAGTPVRKEPTVHPEATLTDRLSRFVADCPLDAVPAPIVHEAKRAMVDGLGVALGGSGHESVELLLRYCQTLGGVAESQVWGRPDRLPAELAALVNGQAEHVLDFDDTFLPHETVIHGTVPVLPGLLAVAEARRLDGRSIVRGLVLGLEIELRLALALGRAHYLGGWHVTATAGPVGGAIGVGALLGLDAPALRNAIGIALTHSGGVTAMFGTMSKAYHCGKAAEAGVRSALLASLGFDSAPEPLVHPQGYLNVVSSDRAAHHLTDRLGEQWRVAENGYKPYSSGVVTHPLIDALVAVRNKGVRAEQVAAIEARVNPWVLQATGQAEPTTGLEGKFSAYHCAAVALLDGTARPAQFTDERVNDPAAVALRRKVRLTPDDALRKDEVAVTVELLDGNKHTEYVARASGTAENPLSDDALSAKFLDLARPVLGARADALLDRVWHLESLADATELAMLLARK